MTLSVTAGASRSASGDPVVESGTPASSPLNAIVVLVDDMDDFSCAEARLFLPRSSAWLRDQGRCFENATGTTPVCCPARGELFSGQLPHNNRVERQIDAQKFRAQDSIQHRLSSAGVTTYGTGKIFNGVDPSSYVTGEFDTGFDDTDAWGSYDYYDYDLYDDEGRRFLPEERVHTTVRTGSNLRAFVSEMAEAEQPFFAYAGFFAPHTQKAAGKYLPEPTPVNAQREVPAFRFRPERNTRDKLKPFRRLDLTRAELARLHSARVRSLYDVDDEIAATFELLKSEDLLESTVVIFASDNGYSMGRNGWEAKAVPYPGSRSIPMLAYAPDKLGRGVTDNRPVGLVDIAPTLFDLYGLGPGYRLDGHSLASRYRRTTQYFEYRNEKNRFVIRESGYAPVRVPTWRMLVNPNGSSYLEYYGKKGRRIRREFYSDAAQHRNRLYRTSSHQRPARKAIKRLHRRLVKLRRCSGTREQGVPNPCP